MEPNFLNSIESELHEEFNGDSPELVERSLALADLGTAGIDGPDKFLPEGSAVFREENLDVPKLLNDPEQRAFLMKRMLAWSQMQVAFAKARKELLDRELTGLPAVMADAVRKLFNKLDASIEAAQQQLEKRGEMTFEELAHDFGYKPLKYTIY